MNKERSVVDRQQSNVTSAPSPLAGEGQGRGGDKNDITLLTSSLNLKVLIVEDDALNRMVAGEILSRKHIDFRTAQDGHEALEICIKERFDLILMDCYMPVMDGWQTTRALRAREAQLGHQDCPIIAMTASKTQLSEQKCLEAGFDEVLEKPLTSQKLDRLCDRFIYKVSHSYDAETLIENLPLTPIPDESPINLDEIEKLKGLLGNALERVFTAYSQNGTRLLAEIEACLQRGDNEGLAASAHALRGGSRTVTARRVEASAALIEEQSRNGELPTLHAVKNLVHEFERAIAMLQSQ